MGLPAGPAQKAKTTQEWLWRNLLALSAPRIGFQGVQTSKPWTIICGLFWRTWHSESITTAWRACGDPL